MFNPVGLAQNAEPAKDVDSILALGSECVMELKLDGIRLLAHVTETGVRTYTRTGKEQTGKLPQIEAELFATLPADTWLDGEIVAIQMREDGSVEHHWGTAQSVMGSGVDRAARASGAVSYSVFDVLAIGGKDARTLPFSARRGLLEKVFAQGADTYEAVMLTPQMAPSDDALAAIIAAGFEGAIVKRLSAPYASGRRGFGWWKFKAVHTEDVIITELPLDGNGKYTGQVGAVVFSQIVGGSIVEKGRCSGMDEKMRLTLSTSPQEWLGRVIEVRHMGIMPSGGWRHPVWLRVRDDKLAIDCIGS